MNKSSSKSTPPGETHENRVVRFRRPGAASVPPLPQPPREPPVADLARFEQSQESASEYRHRMAVNAAAFLFVLVLVGAAIWLADTMATMRKNQDCVLSGRVGCTQVDYTPRQR
jgi:hypothetical protein